MESTEALNPAEILRSLGLTGDEALSAVQGGLDKSIWRVEGPGKTFALRVFGVGDFAGRDCELAAMQAAGAAGLPVPGISASGAWNNHPAVLMDWAEGKPLFAILKENPALAWSLGRQMGTVQAAIHRAALPGDLVWRRRNWIEWAGDEEGALQERLHALSLLPAALLHLDYHPMNVMGDGKRITAVLDWANAMPGDPRADLARTFSIMRIAPLGERPHPALPLLRRVMTWGWWSAYRQAAGPVRNMGLFYAWAGAVMMHDLGQHVGKPGVNLIFEMFEPVRQWRDSWKRRCGLPVIPTIPGVNKGGDHGQQPGN